MIIFRLLEKLEKNASLLERAQLTTLTKNTFNHLEKHNRVVTLLRELEYQIAKIQVTSQTKPFSSDVKASLKKLNAERSFILQCLEKNNSEQILEEKMKELEVILKKMDSNVDSNSKISLSRSNTSL